MQAIVYLLPLVGVLALIFTFVKTGWVSRQDEGSDKMKSIASHIAVGAMAFLKAE